METKSFERTRICLKVAIGVRGRRAENLKSRASKARRRSVGAGVRPTPEMNEG